MGKVIPFFKDYNGTGDSAKPRVDTGSAGTISGVLPAEPMVSTESFRAICLANEGQPLGRRPIPFNQRFYCVYEEGLAVYNHTSLAHVMRYIAKRLNSRPGFVTIKQAMDAGFEIRAV